MASVPGPSRIVRPEFPKRNALSGTVTKADKSNQPLGPGFGSDPLAIRSGRVACARSAEGPESCGVNGCPLYAAPVPASRHSRRDTLLRNGDRHAKVMLDTWRISQSQ